MQEICFNKFVASQVEELEPIVLVKQLNEEPEVLIDLSEEIKAILNSTIDCYEIGYRVFPSNYT